MRISTKFAGQLLIFAAFAATLYDVDAMQTAATKDPVSLKEQCAWFISNNYEKVMKPGILPTELIEYIPQVTNEILSERITKIPQEHEKRKKQVSQVAYDILQCGKQIKLDAKTIEFLCRNYREFRRNEKKLFFELFDSQFIENHESELTSCLNKLHYAKIRSLVTTAMPGVIYSGLCEQFEEYTTEPKQTKNGLLTLTQQETYHDADSTMYCKWTLVNDNLPIVISRDLFGIKGYDFIANDSAICIKAKNGDVVVFKIPWQTIQNKFSVIQFGFLTDLDQFDLNTSNDSDVVKRLNEYWQNLRPTFESVEQECIDKIFKKLKN